MGLYGYSKEERNRIVKKIGDDILTDTDKNSTLRFLQYSDDDDTYVRQSAHIAVGNIVRDDPKKVTAVLKLRKR